MEVHLTEMKQPRVTRLIYSVQIAADLEVETSEISFRTDEFEGAVEGTRLIVKPLAPVGNLDDTRKKVEGWLRSWELCAAIRINGPAITFQFDHAYYEDLASPDLERNYATVSMVVKKTTFHLEAKGARLIKKLPSPPTNFTASPDAETMWNRYYLSQTGKEPIPSMGYFILTMLEDSVSGSGKRAKAAIKYTISEKVLHELGRLTSDVGDQKTGRKAGALTVRAHTRNELDWICRAVLAITRRVGEYDHDPSAVLIELTLNDLPAL